MCVGQGYYCDGGRGGLFPGVSKSTDALQGTAVLSLPPQAKLPGLSRSLYPPPHHPFPTVACRSILDLEPSRVGHRRSQHLELSAADTQGLHPPCYCFRTVFCTTRVYQQIQKILVSVLLLASCGFPRQLPHLSARYLNQTGMPLPGESHPLASCTGLPLPATDVW